MAVIDGAAASEIRVGTTNPPAASTCGNAGNGSEMNFATLKTVDAITVGQNVLVGS